MFYDMLSWFCMSYASAWLSAGAACCYSLLLSSPNSNQVACIFATKHKQRAYNFSPRAYNVWNNTVDSRGVAINLVWWHKMLVSMVNVDYRKLAFSAVPRSLWFSCDDLCLSGLGCTNNFVPTFVRSCPIQTVDVEWQRSKNCYTLEIPLLYHW